MSFVTDKEELKPGLIIFRRADVTHRNWYCRIKLPKVDRYKTVSLKTPDVTAARDRAFDHDADVRFRLKHDVPVFNRPFSQVAEEYVALQRKRADVGEITQERVKRLASVISARLNPYVGNTQIHLIGQDRWTNYPAWRRAAGQGRMSRHGNSRPMTEAELKAAAEAAAAKAAADRRIRKGGVAVSDPKPVKTDWVMVSDATLRFEMSIFDAVVNYAASKRYVNASQKFEGKPNLKTMRRDEFTLEEYRRLHTIARGWIKRAPRPSSIWYRTVTYNFILIMCNTGMRPSEAKNLRWRDVTAAKDRDGREVVVLFVRGKGKSRKLVAPQSVGDYLSRIKAISVAAELDDRVFTTHTGKPANSLYKHVVGSLLDEADLRDGASGIPRSTYSFRHTYATLRLSEGVDVYFLAEQMGTSVKMIQDHYGHVNTIKHADRVLQGMGGWDPVEPRETEKEMPKSGKPAAARAKLKVKEGDAAHAAGARARTTPSRIRH